MRPPALAFLLLPVLAGDPFADGVRAYREGRFEAALDAFAAAESALGDAAPAALLRDRALAALRVGRLREAEYSAEKAVARGGADHAPFRDFLLGSTAFVRCLRAEAETTLTDPDPTAFGRAIAHAEAARDAWLGAAARHDAWPAALRNAERAQQKLDELRQRKAAADRERQSKRENQPQPAAPEEPQPDPDAPPEQVEEAPVAQQDADALTDEQLATLLARLDRKEAEKRALRREQQRAPAIAAEKDW